MPIITEPFAYRRIPMKDEKTLAFINMFAILGCIPKLCELDRESSELIRGENISLGISVKDGPAATLRFRDGSVQIEQGAQDCVIRIPMSSCRKFNGMIDGKVTPIPTKGLTKVGFLLKTFTRLTDRLTKYLRCSPEDLEDEEFFRISTTLMFHVITEAIAQIGNNDKVGMASASYIVDGVIRLSAGDGPCLGIQARDHILTGLHSAPESWTSYMEFADMKLARRLFDGQVNAVTCVGRGEVRIGGMISQVDNVNRILGRVAMYLA